jgi:hypothetical protein
VWRESASKKKDKKKGIKRVANHVILIISHNLSACRSRGGRDTKGPCHGPISSADLAYKVKQRSLAHRRGGESTAVKRGGERTAVKQSRGGERTQRRREYSSKVKRLENSSTAVKQ